MVSSTGHPFSNLSGTSMRNLVVTTASSSKVIRHETETVVAVLSVDSSVLIIRCSVAKRHENFASVKALRCWMAGRIPRD